MKKILVYKNEAGDLQAVKIGFSMPALFLPLIWLISKKMFRHAMIFFPASLIVEGLCVRAGIPGLIFYALLRVLIGYKGNEFLAKELIRCGYTPYDSFEVEHQLDVEAELEEMRSFKA